MRPFDRYSLLFLACISALVVAMGLHAWIGAGHTEAGLFSGAWVSWKLKVARYLATIGGAVSIATIAVAMLVGTRRMRGPIVLVLALALAALIASGVLVDVQLASLPKPAWWISVGAITVALVAAAFGLRERAVKSPLAMVWCSDCRSPAQWIPAHNRVWCQHCALSRNQHLIQAAR